MLPQSVLSTQTIAAPFNFPRNIPRQKLIDYEYGGVDIDDGSQGLQVKVWKGEYLEGDIVLSAPGVAPVAVLSVDNVVDFGFSFDRNMNVFVCYELEDGRAFFYWFDTLVAHYVTTQLASGSATLRCAHDDTRDMQTSSSDIILAYCRGGVLYFRAQRERYQTEHALTSDVGPGGLLQVGMNQRWRLQFLLSTASS